MSTSITLTGTGSPLDNPGRAGPSVLVRAEGQALQFDAGRAIALRWADAGLSCGELTAIFLTHHHSDHLTGLADLVLTSWLRHAANPMPIVAPLGPTADFARGLLESWDDDIAVRMQHVEAADLSAPPALDVQSFPVRRHPVEVWRRGEVIVEAIEVHHEPVVPAVGYRVTTPAGRVAVSGDTVVCEEMEELAEGCDVLVHEAARREALQGIDERMRRVAEYHGDTVEIAKLASRAGVRVLVLTHLIPAPRTPDEEVAFVEDVRSAGFEGELIVGRDLATVWLLGNGAEPVVIPGISPTVTIDVTKPPASTTGRNSKEHQPSDQRFRG